MRAPEPHPEDLPDHSATEEAPSAASQLFDLRTIIAILFTDLFDSLSTFIGVAQIVEAPIVCRGNTGNMRPAVFW